MPVSQASRKPVACLPTAEATGSKPGIAHSTSAVDVDPDGVDGTVSGFDAIDDEPTDESPGVDQHPGRREAFDDLGQGIEVGCEPIDHGGQVDDQEVGHRGAVAVDRPLLGGGVIAQTIGDQIAVLPDNDDLDGELINVLTLIRGQGSSEPVGQDSCWMTVALNGAASSSNTGS